MGHVTYVFCLLPVCLTNRLNISLPYSLDTIGMAGFSHDFGSLKGKRPPVVTAVDSFGTVNTSVAAKLIFQLAQMFPQLIKIPTKRLRTMKNISASIGAFASGIIESARAGVETDASSDKSIIGTLGKLTNFLVEYHTLRLSTVKSESVASESLRMSNDEIMAQVCLSNHPAETHPNPTVLACRLPPPADVSTQVRLLIPRF
jgi:hypothetical protein